MTREECIKECQEMMDNGASLVEIFEWIQDNTDLDAAFIIGELVI